MITKYDKPYMSYDEMITILRERNVIIDDDDFAREALESFSYYVLINGYKGSFLSDPSSDAFIKGTRFEEIYTLHLIDVNLGNILLKYILYFETALKSRLSHLIARKYGVHSYSDPQNKAYCDPQSYLYSGNYSKRNKARNNVLAHLSDVLQGTPNVHFQSESIKYYREKHNHVPPWILTTSLALGEVQKWYNILKPVDKNEICTAFIPNSLINIDDKKEFLASGIQLIRGFRNSAAHGKPIHSLLSKHQIPKAGIVAGSGGLVSEEEYDSTDAAKSGTLALIGTLYALTTDGYIRDGLLHDIASIFYPYEAGHDRISIHGRSMLEAFNLPTNFLHRIESII